MLWDINEEGVHAVADEIREMGNEVFPYVCDCSKKEEVYRVAAQVKEEVGDVACHGNFGPAKKLVRGTKIPGIMVRPDHFPLKNLVRTWNNGPSTSTMFDHNCRL